jgi:predicted  nucleic acid-binding Zn-ribbon protein
MLDPNLELLASCEAELAGLRQECQRLPASIAELEAGVAAARAQIDEVRLALEAVEKRRRTKEAEIADREARKAKLLSQSALVKTNTEYTTLLREIDEAAAQISAAEEDVLLAMEEADALRLELQKVQREQSAVQLDLQRRTEEQRSQLEKALERSRAVERERDRIIPLLGAEIERVYRRVASRGGMPVARLVASSCSACHRAVPLETQNRVQKGEIRTCANCLAILVPTAPA